MRRERWARLGYRDPLILELEGQKRSEVLRSCEEKGGTESALCHGVPNVSMRQGKRESI